MLAIKENRQYTITDAEVDSFKKEGYDIYTEDGKLYAYGFGKSVPFEKYAKIMNQVESLHDDIILLREENENLKKEISSLKKKKG